MINLKKNRQFDPGNPTAKSVNGIGNGSKEWKFKAGNPEAPKQNEIPPPAKPQAPTPVNFNIPLTKRLAQPRRSGHAPGNIWSPDVGGEDIPERVLPKVYPPRSRKL